MMARPMTVEKPLKAKERRLLEKNGESIASSHAPSPPPNSGNHNEEYNERKISSSKNTDVDDKPRDNRGPRHYSASSAERRTALDKLLNSSDVATDVDTGRPVVIRDEERYRNKHATTPPIRNQRYC